MNVVEPFLRRAPRKVIDWQLAGWAALGVGLAILYGVVCMVAGAWITMGWQHPHLPYSYPIKKGSGFVALGTLCMGERTGDLLAYCK